MMGRIASWAGLQQKKSTHRKTSPPQSSAHTHGPTRTSTCDAVAISPEALIMLWPNNFWPATYPTLTGCMAQVYMPPDVRLVGTIKLSLLLGYTRNIGALTPRLWGAGAAKSDSSNNKNQLLYGRLTNTQYT